MGLADPERPAGRDRPWVFRTYSDISSARASNELYRANLAKGQTGLSVAFDLPTQTGYDADHPVARGEVGKVGVPVSTLDDMEEKFGERQYSMGHKNKELMLRYACCFGAFRVLSDSFLTWKNLPLGIYELSTYSFRLEKKGEVVGLKRLRGFTMPDLHTVCADLEQSLEEFDKQISKCAQTGKDVIINYEVIFRATAEFFQKNQTWMFQAAERIGKPVLMEILPERKHYWVCKLDFAAIDYLGRPIENPTIQIDVESGERFGITHINPDEEEINPIIIHCSPTGSIERVICSLFENSASKMDDKPPMLPVWLSPTQVSLPRQV